MGRFRRWGSILAKATDHPVFVQMHASGVPTPVDPRLFFPWATSQPKSERYKLMGLFRRFVMSERYSQAIISEGAHYHDLAGNVTRPVPVISIEYAQRNLAVIAQMRASQREAANAV